MLTITIVVLSFLALAAAGWLAYRLRKLPPIGQLISQIAPGRADTLFPYVEGKDLDHAWDDDRFWIAIGGDHGLDEMSHDARIFLAIGLRLQKQRPELKPEAQYLRMMARYLHWQILAAVIEDRRIRGNPQVPRVQARTCARLYCDMASTLETVNQHVRSTNTS